MSCLCLEPGWFVGNPTSLAHDNIYKQEFSEFIKAGITFDPNIVEFYYKRSEFDPYHFTLEQELEYHMTIQNKN